MVRDVGVSEAGQYQCQVSGPQHTSLTRTLSLIVIGMRALTLIVIGTLTLTLIVIGTGTLLVHLTHQDTPTHCHWYTDT